MDFSTNITNRPTIPQIPLKSKRKQTNTNRKMTAYLSLRGG